MATVAAGEMHRLTRKQRKKFIIEKTRNLKSVFRKKYIDSRKSEYRTREMQGYNNFNRVELI